MAYRRCLSIRSALLARRSNSSFCYISHEDDRHDFSKRKEMASRLPSFGYVSRENDRHKPKEFWSNIEEYVTQRRSLGSNVKSGSWRYSGSFFREGSGFVGDGLCMNRYMSTSIRDGATVLTDVSTEAVASQAPAMGEVAIAAADSAFPVAALQYLIDGVHSFTGLNWWASIALTTVLFRGATIPFLIYEHKSYVMFKLGSPSRKEIQEVLQAADPSARDETLSKMEAICDEYGIPLLMTRLIQGYVFLDFYLAITNMTEQIPSFKNGGALWFTDLTAPDAMFILPFLTVLTFSARSLVWKLEFQPVRDVIPVLFYGALLSTLNFPQALYCHWITSNVFMCCIVYILRHTGVKEALGIPEKPGK